LDDPHPEAGVVVRTDVEELNRVGDPIQLNDNTGYGPAGITYGGGFIWVAADVLLRLDIEWRHGV
jgi:hypothetical protein